MSITTFNQYPYYDDFDETKNYMRILFRPGYSVQARELNQLQTAIQAQIDRFGRNIFKDNAKVLGGAISVDNKVPYVKVESSYGNFSINGDRTNGIASYLAKNLDGTYQAIGKIIRGNARGSSVNDIGNIRAEIIDVIPPVYESTGGSTVIKYPLTLQVRYLNSGGTPNAADDGFVNYFSPDEVLTTEDNTFVFKALGIDTNGIYPTGFGTRLSAEESVYFVKGCFIHVPEENINVSTYSSTPYRTVVYNVIEREVSSVQDFTLNDNSIGTPNEGAPGANRYKLYLRLGLDSFNAEKIIGKNIITVGKIRAGKLAGTDTTQYSELAKTLAKRTYEESGDYYLQPISIKTNELLKNVNDVDPDYKFGVYTEKQIRDIYNTQSPESYGRYRIMHSLGKSGDVAYIKGYRVEFISDQLITASKARSTQTKNNASVDARVGNYIICSFDESSSTALIDLHYEPLEIYNASSELIGTARVRNIEYHSASQIKIFLSNVEQEFDSDGLPIDSLSNLSYLSSTQTADDFILNVDESTFVDENYHSYLFKNPCSVTKSVGDISYVVRDSLILTDSDANAQDQVVLTVKNTSKEEFQYTGVNSFLVIDTDTGSVVEFESVTVDGTTATIQFGTATDIPSNFVVYYDVKRTESSLSTSLRRTKTIQSTSEVIDTPNRLGGGRDFLSNYDIRKITGVFTVSSENQGTTPSNLDIDVTDHYILDNGQRENYYDYGSLRLKCGCEGPPEGSKITVYYEYYQWSDTGEYCTADSYYDPSNILTSEEGNKYETIPTFNSKRYGEINLRDVIDFRPKKEEIENQTAITLARLPRILGDFTFYLPRIDKIYLDKKGVAGISQGVSTESPIPPDTLTDTMILYTIRMNPYTFHPNDYTKTIHNHRRYTMKDIGKLDSRISRLEKFTELNSLEKETQNEQILDDNGDDRFKNGFISDNCKGHILGYTKDFDYSVSINRTLGEVLPSTSNNDIRFVLNETTSSDFRKIGSKLMMPFSQVKFSSNPYATNPIPVEEPVIIPPEPITYKLTTDKYQVVDAEQITFTINTTGLSNGSKLWWIIDDENVIENHYTNRQGQVTINNGIAEFSLTVDLPSPIATAQVLRVTLRDDVNGSPSSPSTASFSSSLNLVTPLSITINPTAVPAPDPTYSIEASTLNLVEFIGRSSSNIGLGNTVTFNIRTSHVSNGTVLYYDIQTSQKSASPVSSSDFEDNSLTGTVTIQDNKASFTKRIKADQTNETFGRNRVDIFTVNLRTSNNGTIVSNTKEISIFDNSQTVDSYPVFSQGPIIGTIELSPKSDNWYDTTTRPIIAFDDELQGLFDVIKDNPDENDEFLSKYIWEGEKYFWRGKDEFDPNTDGESIEESFTESIKNGFYNSNISNGKVSSIDVVGGGTLGVSNEIIPYMRSRKVFFRVTGLKPNTRYIPYFDNVNISNYAYPESTFRIFSENDTEESVQIYNGETEHPYKSPLLSFVNTSINNKLISDSNGTIIGSFIIPNNDRLKFETNKDINFELKEDWGGNLSSKSYAKTTFKSSGYRTINNQIVYAFLPEAPAPNPWLGVYGPDLPTENITEVSGNPTLPIIPEAPPEVEVTEQENNEIIDPVEEIPVVSVCKYYKETYQEEVVLNRVGPIGDVFYGIAGNLTRTLTLTKREEIPITSQEAFVETLEARGEIVPSSPYTLNNISGLYVTNAGSIASGTLDQSELDDAFFNSLEAGTYTIYYVRFAFQCENENNVSPIGTGGVVYDRQIDIENEFDNEENNVIEIPPILSENSTSLSSSGPGDSIENPIQDWLNNNVNFDGTIVAVPKPPAGNIIIDEKFQQ